MTKISPRLLAVLVLFAAVSASATDIPLACAMAKQAIQNVEFGIETLSEVAENSRPCVCKVLPGTEGCEAYAPKEAEVDPVTACVGAKEAYDSTMKDEDLSAFVDNWGAAADGLSQSNLTLRKTQLTRLEKLRAGYETKCAKAVADAPNRNGFFNIGGKPKLPESIVNNWSDTKRTLYDQGEQIKSALHKIKLNLSIRFNVSSQ